MPGFRVNKSIAVITDLSHYDIDIIYSPFYPDIKAPLAINIGNIKDGPVVTDGRATIEKIANLMMTTDNRIADSETISQAQKFLVDVLEDPRKYISLE